MQLTRIHMRTIFTALLLVCFVAGASAQSNKEDLDIIQSIFGKEKKAIVASFVQLDAAKQDAFWTAYDQYETERKALGRQRVALLERYANNYATLDDATTDSIIKDLQKLQASNDKLITKYYGKMKKAAGVKPAAQFYQLEGYFLTMIRAAILDSIPLIGELDAQL